MRRWLGLGAVSAPTKADYCNAVAAFMQNDPNPLVQVMQVQLWQAFQDHVAASGDPNVSGSASADPRTSAGLVSNTDTFEKLLNQLLPGGNFYSGTVGGASKDITLENGRQKLFVPIYQYWVGVSTIIPGWPPNSFMGPLQAYLIGQCKGVPTQTIPTQAMTVAASPMIPANSTQTVQSAPIVINSSGAQTSNAPASVTPSAIASFPPITPSQVTAPASGANAASPVAFLTDPNAAATPVNVNGAQNAPAAAPTSATSTSGLDFSTIPTWGYLAAAGLILFLIGGRGK